MDEKYRLAIPYLEKASQKVNQEGSYYFPFKELGGARFMLSQYARAKDTLLIAEKMGDAFPLTIGTLGVCFDKLGDRKNAMTYYHRYLGLNPDNTAMTKMVKGRLSKLE
ncbi:MAG: hypothetical protein SWO11_20340 [Thermodesulfobacteriota bacterium]|nr:hypothetical protein [Thermodesulfobacteriota bacterium]